MFRWFRNRSRSTPGPAAVVQAQPPAPPEVFTPQPPPTATKPDFHTTVPDELRDLAFTVPAALHEMAYTVPASLDLLRADDAATQPEAAPSPLSWMLGSPAPACGGGGLPQPHEAELLHRIDAALAAPQLPGNLLPRAPAVVPQILGLLRREQSSRSELASQVQRDVLLTAEVLRTACGAQFGSRPVARLEDALDRIGRFGLECAMSRVLMKPMFHAQTGGLTARAAPRIWLYAESKSMFCAELAQPPVDRFDAFLAGLVHDSGWLALLRLIDLQGMALPLPFGQALDAQLATRKDRLFGRLTADWDLTPGVSALSRCLAAGDEAEADEQPLLQVLREADRLCLAHVSGAVH